MKFIEKNKDSRLMLYASEHGFKIYSKWDKGEGREPTANFLFEAELVPLHSMASRNAGSIYFLDWDSGLKYRMTQRNLEKLLKALVSGYIRVTNHGFLGVFTFDGVGGILTVKPYNGEE